MAIKITTVVLLVLVVKVFSSNSDEESKARHARAIGGQSFQRGDWPWLVLLRATVVTRRLFGLFPISHYHLYCGGALVGDRWLLTAAHCFTDNGVAASRPGNWKAKLATVSLRPSFAHRLLDLIGRMLKQNELRQWEIDVDRIYIHPSYNQTGYLSNDIALIKLTRPVPSFSMIQAIALPANNTNIPEPEQTCVTHGWGCTARGGAPAQRAQQIEMPLYPGPQCHQHYNNMDPLDSSRFCAGYRNRNIGVCQGDSGSPLVCQTGDDFTLAGIVSFTSRDFPESYPAVFTRVQNYIPWINSIMHNQG